jgi:hypothetical protein
MSTLADLLASAKDQQAQDFQARLASAQVAFTALVQHAIASKQSEIVHYMPRDIGPSMLAWLRQSGGVASLVIGKDHSELHVNLARQSQPATEPAVQVISPDVATAEVSAVAPGV